MRRAVIAVAVVLTILTASAGHVLSGRLNGFAGRERTVSELYVKESQAHAELGVDETVMDEAGGEGKNTCDEISPIRARLYDAGYFFPGGGNLAPMSKDRNEELRTLLISRGYMGQSVVVGVASDDSIEELGIAPMSEEGIAGLIKLLDELGYLISNN